MVNENEEKKVSVGMLSPCETKEPHQKQDYNETKLSEIPSMFFYMNEGTDFKINKWKYGVNNFDFEIRKGAIIVNFKWSFVVPLQGILTKDVLSLVKYEVCDILRNDGTDEEKAQKIVEMVTRSDTSPDAYKQVSETTGNAIEEQKEIKTKNNVDKMVKNEWGDMVEEKFVIQQRGLASRLKTLEESADKLHDIFGYQFNDDGDDYLLLKQRNNPDQFVEMLDLIERTNEKIRVFNKEFYDNF